MEKFLETYNLPRLSQEVIENQSRPITIKKMESIIKNPPVKTGSGPDGFTGDFYQTFKDELMPILLKLFQNKWKNREHSQTNFIRPALS